MPQEKNNPIKQEKIRKRQELLDRGVNPYPHSWEGSKSKQRKNSLELIQIFEAGKNVEETFYIAGRLMRKRNMGKAAFFNVKDEKGDFQCYIRKDDFPDLTSSNQSDTCIHLSHKLSDDKSSTDKKDSHKQTSENHILNPWELWKLCDIGDILGLSGKLFKTQRGEISLRVKNFQVLCKSLEALPEKYHGLEDKELKYRYRYLDLIMDMNSREVFKTRSKIIQEIRSFMNKKGFIEVETPSLQPLYGGAVAVPFETYFRRLNQKMYLKISPEIYLKKLIVGGFEKVFEIGKNFRNEGIDRSHNPEFTMMEYYEAYTDYKDQMKQFEKLVCHVTKKIKGSLKFKYGDKDLDFTPPWTKITVKEAIKKYSKTNEPIDPDTIRFEDLLKYVQSLEPETDFEKFENILKQIAPPPKELENHLKDELFLMAFELTAEKELWDPTFVTDFPLAGSPLTKKHREQPRIVERFEPYIAGMEIGNAYTELNDPLDQRQRLEKQKRWSNNLKEKTKGQINLSEETKFAQDPSQPIDESFLHALEVGMPPTGGVGLGIERLVMILTNQNNIRDTILFPILKDKPK